MTATYAWMCSTCGTMDKDDCRLGGNPGPEFVCDPECICRQVTFPEQRRTSRVWGDEVLIAETAEYTGKLLYRFGFEPYHRGGLQYHPDRAETAHLVWGEAMFYWVDGEVLRKRLLSPGMTVHIPKGVPHSFETRGNSLVFETSTPGSEPAVNVESQWDITTAVES